MSDRSSDGSRNAAPKSKIQTSEDVEDDDAYLPDDDDDDAFLLGTSSGRGPPATTGADMELRVEWGELRLKLQVPGDANLLALKERVADQLGVPVAALQAVAPGWPHLADSVLLAGLGAGPGSLVRLEGGPQAALLTVYPASFQPQQPAARPVAPRPAPARVPRYQDVGMSPAAAPRPAAAARPPEHAAVAAMMDGLTPRPSLAADLKDMLGLPAFPRVHQGAFRSAVSAAAAARKLLLLYLHWPSHDATVPFLYNTLSAPALVQYIDDNFLFWIGSLEDAVPAAGSSAYTIDEVLAQLRLPLAAPLLGVVAHISGSLSILDIIQGPPAENVDELLVRLINVHDQQASLLAAGGAPLESEAAQLLAEQNKEYEQSLAQDRLKAEQAAKEVAHQRELAAKQKEEEDRRRQAAQDEEAKRQKAEQELAEQLKRKREATAAAVPEEPPAGTRDSTSIVIRLADGSRVQRRFLNVNKLQAVFDFIDSTGKLEGNDRYTLVTSMPKRVLGRTEAASTLAELQLVPQAMLHIKAD